MTLPTPAFLDQTRETERLCRVMAMLKSRAKIGVIYSGSNQNAGSVIYQTYHTRHWKSYQQVALDISQTLRENGFERVVTFEDDMNLVNRVLQEQIDMVWLNTGGVQGRTAIAHAACALEAAGIPYIGHNPLTYALLDHKLHFKRFLQGLGLPTPPFVVWEPMRDLQGASEFLSAFHNHVCLRRGPWVVKPVNGRGSQYIFVIEKEAELLQAIAEVYEHTSNAVLVEQFVPGREYCVSGGAYVWANEQGLSLLDGPLVFGFMEKDVPKGNHIFLSLDQQSLTKNRAWLLSHQDDAAVIEVLAGICRRVVMALSLEYLVRLDLREDEDGTIMILEANPKPDLKRPNGNTSSLVAMGLESIDINYPQFIEGLMASCLYQALTFRPAALAPLLNRLATFGLSVSGRGS